MDQSQLDELSRGLVGYAYPAAESTHDGKLVMRRWLIRAKQKLPDQSRMNDLARQLDRDVARMQREAHDENASGELPTVQLARIGEHHCVVLIEAPSPEHAMGNEAATQTWVVLRQLDSAVEIEDLQGLPKDFWFQMR